MPNQGILPPASQVNIHAHVHSVQYDPRGHHPARPAHHSLLYRGISFCVLGTETDVRIMGSIILRQGGSLASSPYDAACILLSHLNPTHIQSTLSSLDPRLVYKLVLFSWVLECLEAKAKVDLTPYLVSNHLRQQTNHMATNFHPHPQSRDKVMDTSTSIATFPQTPYQLPYHSSFPKPCMIPTHPQVPTQHVQDHMTSLLPPRTVIPAPGPSSQTSRRPYVPREPFRPPSRPSPSSSYHTSHQGGYWIPHGHSNSATQSGPPRTVHFPTPIYSNSQAHLCFFSNRSFWVQGSSGSRKHLERMIQSLGGHLTRALSDATFVIFMYPIKSNKLSYQDVTDGMQQVLDVNEIDRRQCYGIAQPWLEACERNGRMVPFDPYLVPWDNPTAQGFWESVRRLAYLYIPIQPVKRHIQPPPSPSTLDQPDIDRQPLRPSSWQRLTAPLPYGLSNQPIQPTPVSRTQIEQSTRLQALAQTVCQQVTTTPTAGQEKGCGIVQKKIVKTESKDHELAESELLESLSDPKSLPFDNREEKPIPLSQVHIKEAVQSDSLASSPLLIVRKEIEVEPKDICTMIEIDRISDLDDEDMAVLDSDWEVENDCCTETKTKITFDQTKETELPIIPTSDIDLCSPSIAFDTYWKGGDSPLSSLPSEYASSECGSAEAESGDDSSSTTDDDEPLFYGFMAKRKRVLSGSSESSIGSCIVVTSGHTAGRLPSLRGPESKSKKVKSQ